jgi:hypothetical protein
MWMDLTKEELYDIYCALDSAWMVLMQSGNNFGSVYEKPSVKIARLTKLRSKVLAEKPKTAPLHPDQDGVG